MNADEKALQYARDYNSEIKDELKIVLEDNRNLDSSLCMGLLVIEVDFHRHLVAILQDSWNGRKVDFDAIRNKRAYIRAILNLKVLMPYFIEFSKMSENEQNLILQDPPNGKFRYIYLGEHFVFCYFNL
jgi:hypothetical protein